MVKDTVAGFRVGPMGLASRKVRGWKTFLVASTIAVGLGASAQGVEVIHLSTLGAPGGAAGHTIRGVQSESVMGSSVASVGDVNGDGYGDYLSGAPTYRFYGENGVGVAYVVYGGPTPPPTNVGQLPLSGGRGFRIRGEQSYDLFGTSVAGAGDVNGDGLADIIVGAPDASPSSGLGAGAAYVIFGASGSLSLDARLLEFGDPVEGIPPRGFRILGAAGGDRAGTSVAGIGDINGDYYDDVVVGARFSDAGGQYDAGAAYVIFGKPTFTTVDLSRMGTALGTQGFRIDGAAAGDYLGWSVGGAGDVDGDGFGDLVLGAPGFNASGLADAGAAHVIFGKSSTSTISLSNLGTMGFSITGTAFQGRVGHGVAGAGDVNGDGRGDVIVSTYFNDMAGAPRNGRAYVVFGRSGGGTIPVSSLAGGGFEIVGTHPVDVFDSAVSSAGDVNGDGLCDVFLGARFLDRTYGSLDGNNSGGGWIVLGRTGSATVDLATADSDVFKVHGTDTNDFAGTSVAGGGDIDADGLADVLLGVPFADRPPEFGQTYNSTGEVTMLSSPFARAPRVPAAQGTYRAFLPPGNTDLRGVGRRLWSNGLDAIPDSRVHIAFNGGTGPGLNGASEVSVTLARGNAALPGFPATHVGNTRWHIQSNRTQTIVTTVYISYTPGDLGSLNPGRAQLVWAPTLDGPFERVDFQINETERSRVRATLPSLPAVLAFASDLEGPRASIVLQNATPTFDQIVTWNITWSEPLMTGSFTQNDVILDGIVTDDYFMTFVDNGTWQQVRVAVGGEYVEETVRLLTPNGAAYDVWGNPSPAAVSNRPCVIVESPVADGDVNKDGRVNVADITTLGNHIANGTPLP